MKIEKEKAREALKRIWMDDYPLGNEGMVKLKADYDFIEKYINYLEKEKDKVIKLLAYLDFWFGVDEQDIDIEGLDDTYKQAKKKISTVKKIVVILAILFLCGSFFLLGRTW